MLQTKQIKNIKLSKIPQNYAKFLACGYDSIQESFDVSINLDYAEKFFALRYEADYNSHPITFKIENEELQMMNVGASGFKYKIQNDDFQLLIRDPSGKIPNWQVSVRYLSAGLWESGYFKLKERILSLIKTICNAPNSKNWQKVTRCDFCFDFYSTAFAKEMTPELCTCIIATSRTKQQINGNTLYDEVDTNYSTWLKAGRVETITIGNKNSLQVSIYDKTKEITEASGKTWFYQIWGQKYNDSVYRLEIRMHKDWLRNRNIETMEQIEEYRQEIISEALILRRLAVSSTDKNRSRWALHPLWSLAFEINGNGIEVLKIGHQTTMKRKELSEMIIKQMAGCMRSAVILQSKKWDDETYIAIMHDFYHQLFNDPLKNKKIEAAQERYKFVEEAA